MSQITVTFTLDPAQPPPIGVNVRVERLTNLLGSGSMTLQQFRNTMPAQIRTAIRTGIDAERADLAAAATALQTRADTNADAADAANLTTVASALDAFQP